MTKFLKITLFIALACILNVQAHAQIRGNGNMKTIQLDAKNLKSFYVDFPILLELDNAQTAGLSLSTDENIIPHIGIKRVGNQLKITQDQWIEPKQLVTIKGSLPALQSLVQDGYGQTFIKNIDAEQFSANISVGSATFSGKVQQVRIEGKKPIIDALALEAEEAIVDISSFGKVKVNASNKIKARATNQGTIIYDGNPSQKDISAKNESEIKAINEYQEEELKEAVYVTVELKNNSGRKIDTHVSGPRNKRFGYGIPFKSKQKREETWPIGTRLYLVSNIGFRKLIYTVKAEDANEVVELF